MYAVLATYIAILDIYDISPICPITTLIQTMRLSSTVFKILSLIFQKLKRSRTVTMPLSETICFVHRLGLAMINMYAVLATAFHPSEVDKLSSKL